MEKKKLDLLNERSDYAKEVLEKTPFWLITWGNTAFFIFILLTLALSWMIKYPDVVLSAAEITSDNPPVSLVSKSNGKLAKLFIKDGQHVNAADWLAVIENPANTEDVLQLEKCLNFSIDSIIKLLPEKLNIGAYQLAYNNLIKDVNLYKSFILNNPQLNSISSNLDRLSKYKNVRSDYLKQRDLAREEFELKKVDYQRYFQLYNENVISKSELEGRRIELLQAENKYKSFNTTLSNLESDKSIIHKDNSELGLIKKNQEIELLTNINNSVQSLKASLFEWEEKYLLKAPVSGTIDFFEIWKQNQFVTSGKVLFSVIPKGSNLYYARLKTPILNSGKVKVGQDVNIKLNNYPYEEYGMLTGKVNRMTSVANENFFYVEVALDKGLKTTGGKEMQPNNLIGTAEIVTDDLRLIERFIYTLIKALKKY